MSCVYYSYMHSMHSPFHDLGWKWGIFCVQNPRKGVYFKLGYEHGIHFGREWGAYCLEDAGPWFNIKTTSYDRLISTMGFPILVRCYIESGPWVIRDTLVFVRAPAGISSFALPVISNKNRELSHRTSKDNKETRSRHNSNTFTPHKQGSTRVA